MLDASFILDMFKYLTKNKDEYSSLTEAEKELLERIRNNIKKNNHRFTEIMEELERRVKAGESIDEEKVKTGIDPYFLLLQEALAILIGKGIPQELIFYLLAQGATALTNPITIWYKLFAEEQRLRELQYDLEKKKKEDDRLYDAAMQKILQSIRDFDALYDDVQQGFSSYHELLAKINKLSTEHLINKNRIKKLKSSVVALKKFLATEGNVEQLKTQLAGMKQQHKTLEDKRIAHAKRRSEFHAKVKSLETEKQSLESRVLTAPTPVKDVLESDIKKLEVEIKENTELAKLEHAEAQRIWQEQVELSAAIKEQEEKIKTAEEVAEEISDTIKEQEGAIATLEERQEAIESEKDDLTAQAAVEKKLIDANITKRTKHVDAIRASGKAGLPFLEKAKLKELEEKSTVLEQKLRELEDSAQTLADEIAEEEANLAKLEAALDQLKANGVPPFRRKPEEIKINVLKESLANLQADHEMIMRELQGKKAESEAAKIAVIQQKNRLKTPNSPIDQRNRLNAAFNQLTPPEPIPLPLNAVAAERPATGDTLQAPTGQEPRVPSIEVTPESENTHEPGPSPSNSEEEERRTWRRR
jgi:DNA repair exonuclease SbcCD ATPase subunit